MLICYYLDIKLNSDIENFIETNNFIKSEKKLIRTIEELKESQAEYEKFLNEIDSREYMQNFTDENIDSIKGLLHVMQI